VILAIAVAAEAAENAPVYSKGFVRQPRNSFVPVAEITSAMRGSAPDKLDYTGTKCSAVKDQNRCGSCWAFSATEGVESAIAMSTGSLPPNLAVQQLVACDPNDGGCRGGDLPTAFDYIKSDGGLDTQKDYPDTSSASGRSGKCQSHGHYATVRSSSYAVSPCNGGKCKNQDEEGLAAALAKHGPLSICVNANTFNNYHGGIGIKGDSCSGAYNQLDHCVQLVGYDFTGSTPYWKVRNSWSTSWGEHGFIRFPVGVNYCGVADEAMYVSAALVNSEVTV